MLINDAVALLMQIPPTLAGGWAAWFFVGLLLSVWGRREKSRPVVHGPSQRHKSGPVAVAVAEARPVRAAKTAPHSSGDAFGELAALLEPQEGSHRMPGESPVAKHQEAPVLAAPQSLP